MATQAVLRRFNENIQISDDDHENNTSDESIIFSTSNESSDEEIRLKSTGKPYLHKRLSTLSSLNTKPNRKPTRKPDPNTFNRNALMARENRRRKKEYVEKLEKEIHIYRGTNKNLRRIFKKQAKLIEKLQKEKRYYRNILENKSQILSVIKSLNSKERSFAIPLINETPETSPSYNSFNNAHNNFGEIDYNLPFANHDSWEDILGCNSPFSKERETTQMQQHSLQEIQSNIIDEHNYFNSKDDNGLYRDTGVCLHFTSGGKISLEFCPTCHNKSSNKTISDKPMAE